MERLLPWLRRTGLVYIAIALVLAAAAWRVSWGGSSSTQPRGDGPEAVVDVRPVERAHGSVVHVAGAVRRPGVYRVPTGARINAAIAKAGGPSAEADLAAVNLAAILIDGQQVVVPSRATAATAAASGAGPTTISLSSATAEQLESLDGVGPTLAARILEWRRAHGGFASVDQLMEVPGIGEGRLAAIRERVTP
jgi:competence protein ComEA